MSSLQRTTPWSVLAAFAAVYLIWGSTYLAIRVSLETLPPFAMAAVRFLIAGALLYGWSRWRGAARPRAVEWRSAAIIGGFLLLGGNGLVVWAEQTVPSGIAALVVATVPLFMVALDWMLGNRPSAAVVCGLALGFAGVAVLVGPSRLGAGLESVPFDPAGILGLIMASLLWSIGSLYAKRAPAPEAPLLGIGMQMFLGGVLLAGVSLALGESIAVERVSARSIGALGYLIVFGAIIGFSAYVWLLKVASTSKVVTYAFVNPVVAVALGWWLAGEELSGRTLLAAAIIVFGVFLITTARPARRRRAQPAAGRAPSLKPTREEPALEECSCARLEDSAARA